MRRATWTAVGATAAVLLAAGTFPQWRTLDAGAFALGARRAFVAVGEAHFPLPSLPWVSCAVRAVDVRALALAVAVALVLAIALASASLVFRRDRRARVFSLARSGRPAAQIARRTRLSQDAVRALLQPGVGSRR